MVTVSYYRVSVPLPTDATLDLDTIMGRVEYYNSSRRLLIFDTYSEDKHLQFIFYFREERAEDNFIDELMEISNMFESDVKMTPLKPSELSIQQLQKIRMAKRIIEPWLSCSSNSIPRWCLHTKDEVLSLLSEIIGFTEFKEFVGSLEVYLNNTHSIGNKGNYNIVFVNNCGIDEEPFINYIFDLYAAHNIILDNVILQGDFDDAFRDTRNTVCMYQIREQWCMGENGSLLHATSYEQGFQRLAKRNTIYVTAMDKAQYRKAIKDSSFKKLFPHHVELNEPSSKEKLEILKNEAAEYGFAIDTDQFAASKLIQQPIEEIKAQVTTAVSKRLCRNAEVCLQLYLDDFEEAVCAQDKTAVEELADLIGLDEVKGYIQQILTLLERRGKNAVPCLHMVFRGNPGTGKTTVARLIGKAFCEIGILSRSDRFIETDREGLVGAFVGHTAIKTSDMVRDALGGILFIDEAYALASEDGYGAEAISTLVKRMEDYRKEFVCIMAGYTDEMNRLLDINPGLRDRVQFYIDFPDYTAGELMRIWNGFCVSDGYELTADAQSAMSARFEKAVLNKGKNFANARFARKVFERIKMKQAMRTATNEITATDIDAAFADQDMLAASEREIRKIGF